MASADPKNRARVLLARYLDPGARWTAGDDRALRELVREHDGAREAYDLAVVQHRLLVGADPDLPSGFEQRRMMDTLMEALPMPKLATDAAEATGSVGQPWWAALLRPFTMTVATVALLLAMVFGTSQLERFATEETVLDDDDILLPRGAGGPDLTVGLGISGVTRDGQEYEVGQAGTALHLDEWMKISTTREKKALEYAFVFGLQPGRATLWYHPDPEAGQSVSQPVELGRFVPLGGSDDPFEFQLSVRHVTGPLTVVGIFTSEPLTTARVEGALSGWHPGISLDAWLRAHAGLADGAIIRILEVEIVPGARDAQGGDEQPGSPGGGDGDE